MAQSSRDAALIVNECGQQKPRRFKPGFLRNERSSFGNRWLVACVGAALVPIAERPTICRAAQP